MLSFRIVIVDILYHFTNFHIFGVIGQNIPPAGLYPWLKRYIYIG